MWMDSVNSTNDAVRSRIQAFDNMSAVAAVEQTSGRGQGDHTWYSPKGENINVSALLKFSTDSQPGFLRRLPVSEAILLTCCTTLGIKDYLLEKEVDSRIKWPNDIWVGDRKICGILIENTLEKDSIRSSIIGIGFNLNTSVWPEELPNPVSLRELTGDVYDVRRETGILVDKISRRILQMEDSDGRNSLQGEFDENMFRLP